MIFQKGFTLLLLIANVIFGSTLLSCYHSVDSIRNNNFDKNIGVIFKFDTIICKCNDKEYSAIVHKNSNHKEAVFYKDFFGDEYERKSKYSRYKTIYSDTLEIMIDGKSGKLWLFRYKGITDSNLIFQTDGFWKGKLIIQMKDIDGFWAFPKRFRFF
ncbi:MAG: hypothetical protein ABSF80_01005 [Chitinispirillaceae bacterium]|jgi:hypothetical protein